MVISEEQQKNNNALRERLKLKRTQNQPSKRPLAQLAAAEQRIANESKMNSGFLSRLSKSIPSAGTAARRAVGKTKIILGGGAAVGTAVGNSVSTTSEKVRNFDPGFFLFIAGMLLFFFYEYVDNFWLALIIATLFMFYSALTIFEGEGMVIVTLFFIWYVLLGGRYDVTFIRYYGVPFAVAGMLIHGIVKRMRNTGTFSQGAAGELKGAVIPIALFVLDLGLVDILTNYLRIPISSLNVRFLTFVPWWGMLGLAVTKKETVLITVLKVLMIGYILILIFGIVAPGGYAKYQQSLIAGPQEAFQARLDAQREIKSENPLKSYVDCLITGRLTELEVCVKEEQKSSLAESTCKNIGLTSGVDFDQCVQDELARIERGQAKGSTDFSKKEFLEAEFKPITNLFPRLVFNEPRKSYPITLLIKNPLLQPVNVETNCTFTRGSTSVSGKTTINGADGASYSTNLKTEPLNIICIPTTDLDGRYTLEVKATLTNIITTTALTRAFVKSQEEKDRWEAEIKSTALSGFDAGLSSSAAEFARLNYGFGNIPDDPIIITNRPVVFTASVEDLGKGQLRRIQAYLLSSLSQKGFFPTSGDLNCLQQGELVIPQKVKNYHLAECFLELPSDYQQFEAPFIIDTFEAQLVYDYTLTQKVPGIEVKRT